MTINYRIQRTIVHVPGHGGIREEPYTMALEPTQRHLQCQKHFGRMDGYSGAGWIYARSETVDGTKARVITRVQPIAEPLEWEHTS